MAEFLVDFLIVVVQQCECGIKLALDMQCANFRREKLICLFVCAECNAAGVSLSKQKGALRGP